MSILTDFFKENFKRGEKKTSGKQRIEFVDLAKGCCILIVVFLHADFSLDILTPLYLPLFFTLSGFFFKDYDGFLNFMVKKINQLIIPMLFFFAIGLLLRVSSDPSVSIFQRLKQPFVEPTIQNEPIWFLICLFWVSMFYYFAHKRGLNDMIRLTVCISMGLIGMLLDYYSIYLPLFLGSALSATPFFFVGVMLRKTPLLYHNRHDKPILVMAVLILIAVCSYCIKSGTPFIIFLGNFHQGSFLEIMVVSILMVICFLILCKEVRWLPVISYFGRYSIIVLGVHNLFLGYAYLPLHSITGHVFSQLELLGLTLLLTWISIPFFKAYFKKLCAQEDMVILRCRKKCNGSIHLLRNV